MVAVGGNERLCSKEIDLLMELWPALQPAWQKKLSRARWAPLSSVKLFNDLKQNICIVQEADIWSPGISCRILHDREVDRGGLKQPAKCCACAWLESCLVGRLCKNLILVAQMQQHSICPKHRESQPKYAVCAPQIQMSFHMHGST